MKKILFIVLIMATVLAFAGCGKKPSNHGEKILEAKITNIENGIFWIQIDGEDVKVPITYMDSGKEPQIGDSIKIVYTGEINKEKPGIIEDVLKIYLVEEMETTTDEPLVDYIPMVMVDGTLYLTTGKESPIKERKCGIPDGKITSSVSQTEKPTKDNQSNFGTGYEYQYGSEGTIELYMNDKWWVYEAELEK